MGVPSYVLNFDELVDLLKDYLRSININVEGANLDLSNFSSANIENLLRDIEGKIQGVSYTDLINALNSLGAKLDGLSGNTSGDSGIQKIYGEMLDMWYTSDEQQNNIISFTAPAKGKITGITYSLSTWNYQDSWDLMVGDVKLFTGVRTKEYGEHKCFNVFYPIESSQEIKFIYNNVSQASRILWVDFNILEG